jgi:Helix-turn-helix domain
MEKFQLLHKIHGDTRLSRADVCVAYFLVDHFNPAKGCAWPSQEKLAELTGLSMKTKDRAHAIKTVRRSIRRLVQFGIVRVRAKGRHGHATEYVPVWDSYTGTPVSPDTHVAEAVERGHRCPSNGDMGVPGTGTPVSPHPLPSRSIRVGMVRPDAERSPPGGARARAGEAASVFESLWAVWQNKPSRSRSRAKRAVAEVVARADAPSPELLLAKAREYVARVPRGEQRWLHIWLLDEEGWTCVESSPRLKAAEPERASKPKAAEPERASKLKAKSQPPNAAEAEFPRGMHVWDREGHAGEVMHAMDDDDGRRLVAVAWRGAAVGVHRAGELLREKPLS